MPNLKDIDLTLLKDLRDEKELRLYFLSKGTKLTDKDIEELKNLFNFIKHDENSLTLQQLSEIAGGAKLIFKNGKFHSIKCTGMSGFITGFDVCNSSESNNSFFFLLKRSTREENSETLLTKNEAAQLTTFFYNDGRREDRFREYESGNGEVYFQGSRNLNGDIVKSLIDYYRGEKHEELKFSAGLIIREEPKKTPFVSAPDPDGVRPGQAFTQPDATTTPRDQYVSPFTATDYQQPESASFNMSTNATEVTHYPNKTEINVPQPQTFHPSSVYSDAFDGLPPEEDGPPTQSQYFDVYQPFVQTGPQPSEMSVEPSAPLMPDYLQFQGSNPQVLHPTQFGATVAPDDGLYPRVDPIGSSVGYHGALPLQEQYAPTGPELLSSTSEKSYQLYCVDPSGPILTTEQAELVGEENPNFSFVYLDRPKLGVRFGLNNDYFDDKGNLKFDKIRETIKRPQLMMEMAQFALGTFEVKFDNGEFYTYNFEAKSSDLDCFVRAFNDIVLPNLFSLITQEKGLQVLKALKIIEEKNKKKGKTLTDQQVNAELSAYPKYLELGLDSNFAKSGVCEILNNQELYKLLSLTEILNLKFASEDKCEALKYQFIHYNGLQLVKLYCLSHLGKDSAGALRTIEAIQKQQNLFFPMKIFLIDTNATGLKKQEVPMFRSNISLSNYFAEGADGRIIIRLDPLQKLIDLNNKCLEFERFDRIIDMIPVDLVNKDEIKRYNDALKSMAVASGGDFYLRCRGEKTFFYGKPGEQSCTQITLNNEQKKLELRKGEVIYLERQSDPLTYGQIFLMTKDYYLHKYDEKHGCKYEDIDLTKLSLSLIDIESQGVKDRRTVQVYNFSKILLFETLRILNTSRPDIEPKFIEQLMEIIQGLLTTQNADNFTLGRVREPEISVKQPGDEKTTSPETQVKLTTYEDMSKYLDGKLCINTGESSEKIPNATGKTFPWADERVLLRTPNNTGEYYLSFYLKDSSIPTEEVPGSHNLVIDIIKLTRKLGEKASKGLFNRLFSSKIDLNTILDCIRFADEPKTVNSLECFYNPGRKDEIGERFNYTISFIGEVLGLDAESPLLRILRETNFRLSYTAVRDSNGNRTSKLSPISPEEERTSKLIVLTKYVFDVIGSGQCDEVTLKHSIKLLLLLESELLKRKRSEDYKTLNEEIGKLGRINPDRLKRAMGEQKRRTSDTTPQPPKTSSFVQQPGPKPISPRHLVGGSALPDGIEKGWLDANGQLQPEHFEEVFTHIFDQVIRLLGDGKNIPDYLAQYKACMPDHFEMGLRALLPFKGHPEYARRVFELRKAYIGKLSEKYPGKNLSQIPIAERRTVFDKLNASVCLDRAWGSKRPLVAMFDPKGSGNQAVDIDGLTLHSREGETRGEWQIYGRKFTADHHDSKSGRCYKAGEHTDLSRLLDFTLIDPDLCAFTLRSVATAKCFGHEVDFGKIGETPCYREVPGQLSSENIKSLLGRPRFNNGRSIFYTSVFTNVLEKENPGLVAIVNPSNAEWPGGGAGFPGLKGAGEEIMMRTYPGLFPAIHSEAWSRLTSVSHDQGRGNIFNPAVILSEVMSPDTGEPVSFISGAAPDLRSYSSFELFVSAASIIAYNTNPALRRLYEDYTRALVRNMFTAAVASGRPILEIVELGMGAFLGNSDFNVKEKMRSILFDIYREVYFSEVVPGHPFNQYVQLVMCGTGSLPRELTDQRGFVPLGRDLKINLKDEPQPTAQPQMTIAAPQSRSFGFPQPMPAPEPKMQFNPQGDIQRRPSAQPQTTPELLGKITFYLDFSKDVLKRELCTYDSLVSIVNISNNAQILSEARRALTEPEYWNTIGPIVEKAFPDDPVLRENIKAQINDGGILFMMTKPEQASERYTIDMKMINATIDVYRLLTNFSRQDLSRDPKAIEERDKCLALFCLLAEAMMEKTGAEQHTKTSWSRFTDWVIGVVRQAYINPASS